MTRQRVWEIVETGRGDDKASRLFDFIIIALIITSVVSVILSSVPGLLESYYVALSAFELFVLVVFTVEYAVRLWSCTADPAYQGAVRGRLRFAATPLAVVDLLAISPLFLPAVLPGSLLVLRLLRLVRLLRLLKIGRYSDAPRLLGSALKRRRGELIATLFVLGLLVVTMATLLYYFENPARPDVYSSIPVSMWWSILALTGNGQVAPITVPGRLVASGIAVLGVGLFALPAGLLASAFIQELGQGGAGPVQGKGDPRVEHATEQAALAYAHHLANSGESVSGVDVASAAVVLIDAAGWPLPGQAPDAEGVTEPGPMREWHLERHAVSGEIALMHWVSEEAPQGRRVEAIEMLLIRDGLVQVRTIGVVGPVSHGDNPGETRPE